MAMLVGLLLLAAIQAVPPRDGAQRDAQAQPQGPRTGTAKIYGRVTDRDTGHPLAGITVTLSSRDLGPPTSMFVTRTDFDGRYEFPELAGAAYRVMFEPPDYTATYLRQGFGQKRPPLPTESWLSSPTFQLKDGELREANMTLLRGLAIEGRLVGDAGEPLAGIEVAATALDGPAGVGASRSTDDRGTFRLFGLAPGEYRICADPQRTAWPLSRFVTQRERTVKTCYPGTTVLAEAQTIALSTGDVMGVEFRLLRQRMFNVSGIGLHSSGAPLTYGDISVLRLGPDGTSPVSVGMEPDGRFIVRGVTPGDYAVRAEASRFDTQDKRGTEQAYVEFRVDSSDIEGLVVTTSKGTRITGRVVFEDGPPEGQIGPIMVRVRRDARDKRSLSGTLPTALVEEDLTFELAGLFGPHVVTMGAVPEGWFLKSVTHKGEDITDRVVDFGAGGSASVQIVLTKRAAHVSGHVAPSQGGAAPAPISVILLPAARELRGNGTGFAGLTMVRPDGSFRLEAVRAGDYLIAAIEAEVALTRLAVPLGPDYLERLSMVAERITLGEGEEKSINLRPVKPQ